MAASPPTLVTAALAGVFSGALWPSIAPLSTVSLMLGTMLLVVFPAHAFVVGFKRPQGIRPGTLDTALLGRLGAWIACAACASFLASSFGIRIAS